MTSLDLDRYRKQVILEDIGHEGQHKLLHAHVCIVGCGGLGAIAAMYLAGAGIGNITLVDFDKPDLSNLHRQVVYDVKEPGTKADQLALQIQKLNPDVRVHIINKAVHKDNIDTIIKQGQIVLDCTDDLNAKYLLSDYTAIHQIPLIYASIHKFVGYISVFNLTLKGERSACLRDFFPEKANLKIPSCSDIGAYNVLAGMFGLLQANEAIKTILGIGDILQNKLMIWNAKDYSQQMIKVKPNQQLDLQKKYETEDYGLLSCADTSIHISLHEWKKKNKGGIIISVLEHEEEDLLDIAKLQYPTTAFEEWKDQFSGGRDYLLYCRTGRRSDQLCNLLKVDFPDARFYSLKGGFMAYANGVSS
jgi:adenylyltransferase/sulfurtransferase